MKQVYLDYAAATPVSDASMAAMEPFFQRSFYNPSALYGKSREALKALDELRHRASRTLGVKPTEIIFTSGGSEANNLALCGVGRKWPEGHIVSTSIEHDSVLEPLKRLAWENNSVTLVEVDRQGRVDLQKLQQSIADDTVLVSVMYANNEIGTVQDIRKIAAIVAEVRKHRHLEGNTTPLFLHTDACQATNYLDIMPHRLGVDLMTLNSGKIYGPKQCGLLYVRAGVHLEPIIYGGGQERGLRSGTESLALIAGFVKALEEAAQNRKAETARMLALQKETLSLLSREISSISIQGHLEHRIANNIHFRVPNVDNERLLYQLDEAGFMVATGSACSASSDEPNHVLYAIGLSDEEARTSIRLTMGRATQIKDMKAFVKSLKTLVH